MSYSIDIASIINNINKGENKRTSGKYVLNEGDIIDGLRVDGVLGDGGQGEVYKVYDKSLGCYLALKLLHRAGQVFIDTFQSEMKILASLRHPNIIQIKRAGVWNERPYYVMELLDKLPEFPTEEEVYRWTLFLCDAVDEIGRRGLVHGDIKPENVLWDGVHHQPVLTDFGTVTEIGNTSKGGTPSSSSPEQLSVSDKGAAICVTETSDVFALGNFALRLLPEGVEELSRWKHILGIATSQNEQLRYNNAKEFAKALRHSYKKENEVPVHIIKIAIIIIGVMCIISGVIHLIRENKEREAAEKEAAARERQRKLNEFAEWGSSNYGD